MNHSTLPPSCPSCGASLRVVKLRCPACATEVSGDYELCPVCRLEGEARRLFELFLQARGNLKEVQKLLEVSYPTTRQRIDEMFRQLERGKSLPDPLPILKKVRSGELDVETAERILRGELR